MEIRQPVKMEIRQPQPTINTWSAFTRMGGTRITIPFYRTRVAATRDMRTYLKRATTNTKEVFRRLVPSEHERTAIMADRDTVPRIFYEHCEDLHMVLFKDKIHVVDLIALLPLMQLTSDPEYSQSRNAKRDAKNLASRLRRHGVPVFKIASDDDNAATPLPPPHNNNNSKRTKAGRPPKPDDWIDYDTCVIPLHLVPQALDAMPPRWHARNNVYVVCTEFAEAYEQYLVGLGGVNEDSERVSMLMQFRVNMRSILLDYGEARRALGIVQHIGLLMEKLVAIEARLDDAARRAVVTTQQAKRPREERDDDVTSGPPRKRAHTDKT